VSEAINYHSPLSTMDLCYRQAASHVQHAAPKVPKARGRKRAIVEDEDEDMEGETATGRSQSVNEEAQPVGNPKRKKGRQEKKKVQEEKVEIV
jgi:hypothetical protein